MWLISKPEKQCDITKMDVVHQDFRDHLIKRQSISYEVLEFKQPSSVTYYIEQNKWSFNLLWNGSSHSTSSKVSVINLLLIQSFLKYQH